MSGAMREKDAADYDLERFVDMFDQALTSDDPRVKNALRQLMMMVVLTDDHEKINRTIGPLRRMQEDIRDTQRVVESLRREIQNLQKQQAWSREFGVADSTGSTKAQGYGAAIPAQEFWNSLAPAKIDAQISEDIVRSLNTSIAPALKGLKDA
jgi:hypothetical protein